MPIHWTLATGARKFIALATPHKPSNDENERGKLALLSNTDLITDLQVL